MDDELELGELRKVKKKLVARNNFKELSKVCNRLGEVLFHSGRYKDALIEHEAEEAACVAANDDIGLAVANRKIGECYAELGEYEKALFHQNKHLELAYEIHSEVEVQRALATIGRTHLYIAEALKSGSRPKDANDPVFVDALNSAEESFHKSLEVCSRLYPSQVGAVELDQMKGRLYHNLGMVMEHRNNNYSCVNYIEKALALHRKHNQWEDLQRCHHYLSLVYRNNDDTKKCMYQSELALEAAVKLNDFKLQSEVLALMGQVYIQEEDYTNAMKVLRRAMKLDSPIIPEKEEVERLLRIARRLRRLRMSLYELRSDDAAASNSHMLMEAYDKMGDLCIKARIFNTAIKYYTMALHNAELMHLPKKDLASFYVSLAQTYRDVGKYKNAADNLVLELQCYEGNPKEKCRTLLNLADCRERCGAGYVVLEPLYLDALHLAKESGDCALEKQCLVSLSVVQEYFNETEKNLETQKMLSLFLSENGNASRSSSEDEEESESDTSQSSNVSYESIESDSDAEVSLDVREVQCPRTKRRYRLRRNEKGETPLHRACIAGNLKRVKELIAVGHPINERDYGGWLPLHEAANHDFPEIVKLLLENEALVNDCGGTHCEGITPLHDAASNGNIEVMRILLSHGASVMAKTDAGQTVLDCLISWKHRAKNETSPELLAECDQMAEEIRRIMSKNLCSDEMGTFQNERNSSNVGTFKNGQLSKQRKSTQNPNLLKEGSSHLLPVISSSSTCTVAGAALMEDSEILPDCDDWLIDDLGPTKHQHRENFKRRRCDIRSWVDGATHSRKSSNASVCSSESRLQERSHMQDRSNVFPKCKRQRRQSSDNDHISEDSRLPSPLIVAESSEGAVLGAITSPGATLFQPSSSSVLRVKVNIMGTLLLIPVPSGETVFWLAKEAAQRYYAKTGLRPNLSLSTSDGALLSPDDAVDVVISSGEEVIGSLQSWELSPLPERYVDSCKLANAAPFWNIRQILSVAETSMCASLANLRLTPDTFQPIFRALQCQTTLKELNLSGNRLGKQGLQGLAMAMQHLPGLRILDISSNDITDLAVGQLVQPILQYKKTIMLETLHLDFNPLLEDGCTNLILLLKCFPNLTSLSIRSICTDLSSHHSQSQLSDALATVTKLQQLNLSLNCLSIEKLESLLPAIPLSCLLHLNLSAVTVCVIYATRMCAQLSRMLQSHLCILRELCLSRCSLDDDSISALLPGLSERRNMEHLDVSGNPALTANSADALSKLIPLTRVKIDLCANSNENNFLHHKRLDLGNEEADEKQIWTNVEDGNFVESYIF